MVKNLAGFQKMGSKFVVVWEVVRNIESGDYLTLEDVVAVFRDPRKAATYCCKNKLDGVHMSLYNIDWDFTTKD